MSDDRWDVVVIGAGLNGMTLANYLLRAGLSVLVIERRLESGCGLASEEPALTGYWANTGQYVFDTLDLLPVHDELGLGDVNVEFLRPDVQSALLLRDGRALLVHRDLDRTVASVAAFSAKDADAWRRLAGDAAAIPAFDGAALRRPATASPPRVPALARLSRLTPREVLDASFEHEAVKSLVLHHLLAHRGVGPDEPDAGTLVPFAIARSAHGQIVHEGSHELAQGLWTAIVKRGGDVWDFTEVTRIVVEDGRATGVELADGSTVRARTVVSTLDPATTRRLVGDTSGDRASDELSLFTVHVALREAPQFRAADPDVARALRYAIGLETVADHASLWDDARRGALPSRPAMFASFPSVHDASQAPPGHHTALMWQFVPRTLRGQAWRDVREPFMHAVIGWLRDHVPNLHGDEVAGAAAMTPDDLVGKFPNLGPGIFGGPGARSTRPAPVSHDDYRGPAAGLYLAGAAMPPGAGLSPAPALACLEVLAADLRVERWWART